MLKRRCPACNYLYWKPDTKEKHLHLNKKEKSIAFYCPSCKTQLNEKNSLAATFIIYFFYSLLVTQGIYLIINPNSNKMEVILGSTVLSLAVSIQLTEAYFSKKYEI